MRENPLSFMKRWHDGMTNLSPVRALRVQMHAQLGATCGMIFAFAFILYRDAFRIFAIAMFFFTIIQILAYYKSRKQYLETKRVYEDIEIQNQINKLENGGNYETKNKVKG